MVWTAHWQGKGTGRDRDPAAERTEIRQERRQDTGQHGQRSAEPMPESNSGAINKERGKREGEEGNEEREGEKGKEDRDREGEEDKEEGEGEKGKEGEKERKAKKREREKERTKKMRRMDKKTRKTEKNTQRLAYEIVSSEKMHEYLHMSKKSSTFAAEICADAYICAARVHL